MHSIIAAGVLLVMLFCAGVIIMSIYRKWKIEQEIEGLLWKISREDIQNYFEKDIISSPSRVRIFYFIEYKNNLNLVYVFNTQFGIAKDQLKIILSPWERISIRVDFIKSSLIQWRTIFHQSYHFDINPMYF